MVKVKPNFEEDFVIFLNIRTEWIMFMRVNL